MAYLMMSEDYVFADSAPSHSARMKSLDVVTAIWYDVLANRQEVLRLERLYQALLPFGMDGTWIKEIPLPSEVKKT